MIRAIIFDFDGLILETEGPIFQSWQECYQELGGELSLEKWGTIIGMSEGVFDPFDDLEAQLGKTIDRAAIAPGRQARERELVAAQSVLPGVESYLRAAMEMGLKIGLASSSPCVWVEGHLKRLNLFDYFECIRASDDVKHTKPAPDLFLATLECLEVASKEAIVLEDSPNGVEAARKANIFVVAVPNDLTRQLDLDHANMRLDSLADMPLAELLQAVESKRDRK
jgi:HAD superfamily hydrolase (TIGR01509 family)